LCVLIRLKAIKQDPRMARPEARGDGDWVVIADCAEPYGICYWLRLYYSFFQGRPVDMDRPFFVADDLITPFVYPKFKDQLRVLWSRTPGVTLDLAKTRGPHGLRVHGNNRTRQVLGALLAQVQGGWASEGTRSRYDRADMSDVVRIPQSIVGSWSDHEPGFDFDSITGVARAAPAAAVLGPQLPVAPVEREVHAYGASRNLRAAKVKSKSQSTPALVPPSGISMRNSSNIPVGWSVESKGRPGNIYNVFISPTGRKFRSYVQVQAFVAQDSAKITPVGQEVVINERTCPPRLSMSKSRSTLVPPTPCLNGTLLCVRQGSHKKCAVVKY